MSAITYITYQAVDKLGNPKDIPPNFSMENFISLVQQRKKITLDATEMPFDTVEGDSSKWHFQCSAADAAELEDELCRKHLFKLVSRSAQIEISSSSPPPVAPTMMQPAIPKLAESDDWSQGDENEGYVFADPPAAAADTDTDTDTDTNGKKGVHLKKPFPAAAAVVVAAPSTVMKKNVLSLPADSSGLDIKVLADSIGQDDEVLRKTHKKQVILLVGKSKAGKTTLVCTLSGKELALSTNDVKDDDGAIIVGEEVIGTVQEVPHLRISHQLDSCTKSLAVEPLPNSNVLLVDSCGFEDTEGTVSGHSVDIASAVSLRNAMKGCQSLRPVVVVNKKSVDMDGGKGFVDLLNLILRFFSPVEEFLPSMHFLFTRCAPDDEHTDLYVKLKQLGDARYVSAQPELSKIVKGMREYVRKHEKLVMLSVKDYPVVSSSGGGGNGCHKMTKLRELILNSDSADRLSSLGCPISEDAQIAISDQCREAHLAIKKHLDESDFDAAHGLLVTLRTLHFALDLAFVTMLYNNAISEVRAFMDALVCTVEESIENWEVETLKESIFRLRDAQRGLNEFYDVGTQVRQFREQLNTVGTVAATGILSRGDLEESTDLMALDKLRALYLHFGEFLDLPKKYSHTNAVSVLQDHVKEHVKHCKSFLEVFSDKYNNDLSVPEKHFKEYHQRLIQEKHRQCGGGGRVDTPKMSDMFRSFFNRLDRLKGVTLLKEHIEPNLVAAYNEIKAPLNASLFAAKKRCETQIVRLGDQTLAAEKQGQLFRSHWLLEACFAGGADTHIEDRSLKGLDSALFEKMIEAYSSHLQDIDNKLLARDLPAVGQIVTTLNAILEAKEKSPRLMAFQAEQVVHKMSIVKRTMLQLCKNAETQLGVLCGGQAEADQVNKFLESICILEQGGPVMDASLKAYTQLMTIEASSSSSLPSNNNAALATKYASTVSDAAHSISSDDRSAGLCAASESMVGTEIHFAAKEEEDEEEEVVDIQYCVDVLRNRTCEMWVRFIHEASFQLTKLTLENIDLVEQLCARIDRYVGLVELFPDVIGSEATQGLVYSVSTLIGEIVSGAYPKVPSELNAILDQCSAWEETLPKLALLQTVDLVFTAQKQQPVADATTAITKKNKEKYHRSARAATSNTTDAGSAAVAVSTCITAKNPTVWVEELIHRLELFTGERTVEALSRVEAAKEGALDGLTNKDAAAISRHLDCLHSYCVLDEHLQSKPMHTYMEVKTTINHELHQLLLFGLQTQNAGKLDDSVEIKTFFTGLHLFTDHFEDFPAAFADDLISGHQDAVKMIPHYVKQSLESGNTSLYRSVCEKMLDIAGSTDGQDQAVYRQCQQLVDAHIIELGRNLYGEGEAEADGGGGGEGQRIDGDEELLDNERLARKAMQKLLERLSAAMVLEDVAANGKPFNLLVKAYERTDDLYTKLERQIVKTLMKANFMKASSLYFLLLQYRRMDHVLHPLFARVVEHENKKALLPFAARITNFQEMFIENLELNVVTDCSTFLLSLLKNTPTKPTRAAPKPPHTAAAELATASTSSPQLNLAAGEEKDRHHDDDDDAAPSLLNEQYVEESANGTTSVQRRSGNHNKRRGKYVSDMRSLETLVKRAADAASNEDASLFGDLVSFDSLIDALCNIYMQHAANSIQKIKWAIYDNNHEAARFLISLSHVLLKCFRPVVDTHIAVSDEHELSRQERNLTAAEEDSFAQNFVFNTAGLRDTPEHLRRLQQEDFQLYSSALTAVKSAFIVKEATVHSLVANAISTSPTKQLDLHQITLVFDFIDAVLIFKNLLNARENMTKAKCDECFQVFASFLVNEYAVLAQSVKRGSEIGSLKVRLTTLLKNADGLKNKSLNEPRLHDEICKFASHVSALIEQAEKWDSNLQQWKATLGNNDLFTPQDIPQMITRLDALSRQKAESAPVLRTFSDYEAQKQLEQTDDVLATISTQLDTAQMRAAQLIANEEFATVAVGVRNIEALIVFEPLHRQCEEAIAAIKDFLKNTAKKQTEAFETAFKERDFIALDAVIRTVTAQDTELLPNLPPNYLVPLTPLIDSKFNEVMNALVRQREAAAGGVDDFAAIIVNVKEVSKEIRSDRIQKLTESHVIGYLDRLLKCGRVDLIQLDFALHSFGVLGIEVANTYPHFEDVRQEKRAKMTSAITIEHALTELAKDNASILPEQIEAMRERYALFSDRFDKHLQEYTGLKPLEELIRSAMRLAGSLKSNTKSGEDGLPLLLADVFAVWSINRQQTKMAAGGTKGKPGFLIRPHPVQMVAIFRLLRLDQSTSSSSSSFLSSWYNSFMSALRSHGSNSLPGHLVQVGTGEGKSILLGGLSCILGLLGYDVYCASHSQHLSKRDYESFQPLFVAFGLVKGNNPSAVAVAAPSYDYITYNTLGGLVEAVINKDGDIRSLARAAVLKDVGMGDQGHHSRKAKASSARPSILLIDEVDVFFSKDFFGSTYNPIATFEAPELVAIMEAIWKAHQSGGRPLQMSFVQAMPEYQQLVDQMRPHMAPLLNQQLNLMIEDASRYNQPAYELVMDASVVPPAVKAIGYKDQDSISTSIRYGYRTAFAYLYEISRLPSAQAVHLAAALPQQLSMQLPCGMFSYAEVPKHGFRSIMGVTGTLACLSPSEKAVVHDHYHITEQTLAPSLYGISKTIFTKDTLAFKKDTDVKMFEDQQRYFQAIAKEIKDAKAAGAATIVFFETAEKQKAFVESTYCQQDLGRVMAITEKDKDLRQAIVLATRSKAITFFTSSFGRGWDFECFDPEVDKVGGVFVIQTFFSQYLSEEIQIQGRTARQNKSGKYKMLLLESDLTCKSSMLELTSEQLAQEKEKSSFYDFLNDKRVRAVAARVDGLVEKAKHAHAMQHRSQKLLDMLKRTTKQQHDVNLAAIRDMMIQFGSEAGGQANVKPVLLIFCLDESGSMSPYWNGLLAAYHEFVNIRHEAGGQHGDLVSVIQFSHRKRITANRVTLSEALAGAYNLSFSGGGTSFVPVLQNARDQMVQAPPGMDIVVVFMTDGESSDIGSAVREAASLRSCRPDCNFMFYGIGFSPQGQSLPQVTALCDAAGGKAMSAGNISELKEQFRRVATEVSASRRG